MSPSLPNPSDSHGSPHDTSALGLPMFVIEYVPHRSAGIPAGRNDTGLCMRSGTTSRSATSLRSSVHCAFFGSCVTPPVAVANESTLPSSRRRRASPGGASQASTGCPSEIDTVKERARREIEDARLVRRHRDQLRPADKRKARGIVVLCGARPPHFTACRTVDRDVSVPARRARQCRARRRRSHRREAAARSSSRTRWQALQDQAVEAATQAQAAGTPPKRSRQRPSGSASRSVTADLGRSTKAC